MKIDINKLIVKFNNEVVGYLENVDNNKIAFQYDENWVRNGFSISPFSLPLNDEIYISNSSYFEGLFGVFYDSLPDGWGKYLVIKELAKKGINYERLNVLTKLSLVSKEMIGALSYEPNYYDEKEASPIKLDEIAININNLLVNQEEDNLNRLFLLGGASGGARPKINYKYENENWIVKFKALNDPSTIGLDEYKANMLAQKAGININEYKLFDSKISSGYFAAKRFDIINNEKIHVISLAAILETTHRIPNLDYNHFIQVADKISVDKNDVYEVFRRCAFNVLYGNKDDHSKNHSFIYDEEKKGYVLSKAYDITKTVDKFEHEITVNGSGNPTEEELFNLAKERNLDINKCILIIKKIREVLS